VSYNFGVPAPELHCPTCGARFIDFRLRSDPEEFDIQVSKLTREIQRLPATPWYILCPNGHKWTIKTIWRAENEPDSVLLDKYLGDE
jgi:hypothetical protein